MVKTEQEAIDDYRRVEAFLADPAVKEAFAEVDAQITREFKASKSNADMEAAWAKSKALDMLAGELLRTMNAGQVALMQREQREKDEAVKAARQKRSR